MADGMTRDMKWLLLALAAAAVAGAGFSAYTLHRPRSDGADVKVITHGEQVDILAHLARGKYTVFDFYAVWCPPCRVLGPALERLAAKRSDRLAVRKVDIVDWTMPVAEPGPVRRRRPQGRGRGGGLRRSRAPVRRRGAGAGRDHRRGVGGGPGSGRCRAAGGTRGAAVRPLASSRFSRPRARPARSPAASGCRRSPARPQSPRGGTSPACPAPCAPPRRDRRSWRSPPARRCCPSP
ncbi:MAG: hypothetical protein DMF50_10195 [Acidobacteria bacterium]|nr:MAG: hypothetical protein DMF50_10195 [Acidobacteriota bacterium]